MQAKGETLSSGRWQWVTTPQSSSRTASVSHVDCCSLFAVFSVSKVFSNIVVLPVHIRTKYTKINKTLLWSVVMGSKNFITEEGWRH